MKNNWTHERISRKAEAYQWDGSNTDQVFGLLAQHGMVGELFRDNQYIQVYYEQSYDSTLSQSDWLLVGEDSVLRFYSDEKFRLMYRPIDDELERLRAFAREILDRDRGDDIGGDELQEVGEKHGLLVAHYPKTPCGDDCVCADYYACSSWNDGEVTCYRLAESLKAYE